MDYVTRDTARVVIVGVVAVAAIAMGAATIQSTVAFGTGDTADPSPESDPSGQQGGGLEGAGEGNVTGNLGGGGEGEGFVADLSTCVRPLSAWYGGLAYFGIFGLVVLGIRRRYSTGASFLGMYALAPVVLTAYFFATNCASANRSGGGNSAIVEGIGDAADTGLVALDVPPIALVGVFGLVLVGTAVVLYRASGDQEFATDEEESEESESRADVGDLAAAAAAAADRLERHNADVDNEVYRAWRDMTELLDVPKPRSSTPGEFAAAAVAAGLDEADVARLTELFEEVRYGERDPESREERAIEVFRSIEAEYGTDGDAAATGGDSDGR